MFDAFRQADGSSTRSHGGLGLGLSIVKHIVEAHHGSVEVHSAGYGHGARFVVRLPLLAASVKDTAEWSPRPSSGSFAALPRLQGLRVLVVDDDADSRDMLSMILVQAGATVECASSAPEALQRIARAAPDLLLSDIGMPGVSGYELMQQLRADERVSGRRALPAIALTGYATPEDGARAIAAGFEMHMSKPVEPAELLVLIGELVGGGVAVTSPSVESGRVTIRA